MKEEMELKLCAHCAPTLAGMKSGNLVWISGKQEEIGEMVQHWNELLSERGVKACRLRTGQNGSLVYVYREKRLKKDWSEPEAAAFLSACGYGQDVEENLRRLTERMASSEDFPHEIGLFLSYPLEDVKGFIENGGQKYRLCGIWKVYGDAEAAQRCFDRYRKCAQAYVRCYHKGRPLIKLTVAS